MNLLKSYGVQIGNGDAIECDQLCKNAIIQLSGLLINEDFYPSSIKGGGRGGILVWAPLRSPFFLTLGGPKNKLD